MEVDKHHLFQGEVQGKKNRATGFHSTAQPHPHSQPSGPVLREDPHSHVYEQGVKIQKPSSGNWYDKRQPSTFFPNDFSARKVERTVQRAHTISQSTGMNPVDVPWRRFADTREESGGMMKVDVRENNGKIRGFPVL